MQTSSKKSWRPSPSPGKDAGGHKASVGADFDAQPVVALESVRGWSLPVGSDLVVLLEYKLFVCLGLAAALYALAALLANEWLYLLAAGLVIVAFMGTLMPLLMVLTITGDCWLPENAIASESAEIAIALHQRRWLGPLSLLLPAGYLRTRVVLSRRTTRGFVPEQNLSKQPILLEAIGKQAVVKFTVPLLQRGVYKLSHVELTTAFPFGIAWWTRSLRPDVPKSSAEYIVVYPRCEGLRGNFLLDLKGVASAMGLAFTERLSLTQSTSVRSVRDFRTGDSLRHIHWKSTARLGRLLVREFDSETLPEFDLLLNLRANWSSRDQFELAVCLANSLVNFGYEHDMLPELFLNPPVDSPELAELMRDLPTVESQLELFREILARVEPTRSGGTEGVAEGSGQRQMLSMIPSMQKMWRHTKDLGDHIVSPVHLSVIEQNDQSGSAKAQRLDIASVFCEEDLQSL